MCKVMVVEGKWIEAWTEVNNSAALCSVCLVYYWMWVANGFSVPVHCL